jgi:hypothetical protein
MSSSKCSSPTHPSWRTSRAKFSPTLGTSNSYIVSTIRKDFQVFLHISDAPVGFTDVNFLLNKVKGDSAFSLKTKSPSVTTAGVSPLKMVPFFAKRLYFKSAKYVST